MLQKANILGVITTLFYLTTKNIPGKSSQEVAKKEVSS